MKTPPKIKIYGDMKFRGACPSETLEQVTFFARIRKGWPDTWGVLAIHPRNEARRNFRQVAKEKSEGMTTGSSDIVIPGSPSFICELKRRDHTKSILGPDQERFLLAAQEAGAFTCIALGADAAMEAFNEFLAQRQAK